ncbi:MAG: hypothetical protein SGILL_004007 [Bacillariaceae sp.]
MMQKAETSAPASSEKKIVTRVCASKQFPGKLHDLLTYAETHRLDWVISWCHEGKAFIVHSQEHLLQILPIFFGQTKFRSFQRQLNVSAHTDRGKRKVYKINSFLISHTFPFPSPYQMWHFERVLVGPFKGAFMHPCFVRGNRALCASMSRHHLPSAEMYSRALLEGASGRSNANGPQGKTQPTFNQYVLDNRPDQLLTIDRNQHFMESSPFRDLKIGKEISPQQSTMKTVDTTEKKANESAGAVPETAQYANDSMEKVSFHDSVANGEKSGATKDQEEDWSLLSDCLQHVLNPETFTCNPSPIPHKATEGPIRFPLDALATGMDEPATPETIEDIFAEFSA